MSKQILNNVCCFVSIILLIGCLLTLAGCGDIKLNISRQSKVVNVTTSANSRPTISWSIGGDIKKLGERTLFYIEKLACFKFAQKPKVAGAVARSCEVRSKAKRSNQLTVRETLRGTKQSVFRVPLRGFRSNQLRGVARNEAKQSVIFSQYATRNTQHASRFTHHASNVNYFLKHAGNQRISVCPQFRIRLCPDHQFLQMQAAAEPVPPVNYNGFEELPLYERRTSFAKGLRLNEPTPGNTDPWPWLPQGEGTQWCKDEGRADNFSLKISKNTPGPSEWIMEREGEGAWTQRWTPSTSFRVSAYIKTDGVKGRGSFLAVRWGVYNYPERYPYICSQKLVGTCDWTLVSVEINGPPPPDISAIYIILRQDGSGTTWFDDLQVEVLSKSLY